MLLLANTQATQVQESSAKVANIETKPTSISTVSTTSKSTKLSVDPAKVTVEIPTSSSVPFNPFDPTWIKLWEQVGPISYLALLCVFIWLLTRFVETVKSK